MSVLHFSNLISICVFPRAVLSHHIKNVYHLRLSLTLFVTHGMLQAYVHNSFSREWAGWVGELAAGETTWNCVWDVVREMRSLHTALVTIEIDPRFQHCTDDRHWLDTLPEDFETSLFEPIKQITCNHFYLQVNWPARGPETHQYPFQLERITNR